MAASRQGIKTNKRHLQRGWQWPCLVALLLLGISACGGDGGSDGDLSGRVRIDGSSTVQPLSAVAAELFGEDEPRVQVTVGTSGTGGGFEKFCRGETDISDASRPIEDDEIAACQNNNVTYEQFTVANDALTVVVNADNDWVDCLTVDQLKRIWEPNSQITSWNQLDPAFPNEPLQLFGPGTDSGTFDYFTEAINGEEGASRTDYSPSEDDNVTVRGVEGSTGGLGYFGFSFYEDNSDSLKALEIDGGQGCVAPSPETTQDGTYTPLARPLFIYPSASALDRPEVLAFVEFYVENHEQIAEEARFVQLNATQEQELQASLDQLREQAGR